MADHCPICGKEVQGITEAPGSKLLKKPSIEMTASGDAFRVKPAPSDGEN